MSFSFSIFLRFIFPAFIWALIIFIASSIPAEHLPKSVLLSYDKIFHIIMFFILVLLVYRAVMLHNWLTIFSWVKIIISVFVGISYGVIDEFHQGLIPGRTFDYYDMLANSIGACLSALVLFLLIKGMFQPQKKLYTDKEK